MQPHGPRLFHLVQQAEAPFSSRNVPNVVMDLFSGPSGSVAARDALYAAYADVTPAAIQRINAAITEVLTRTSGWSARMISDRVRPLLEDDGFQPEEAARRADIIARTEPRAIVAEWQTRLDRAEMNRRGEAWLYDVVGADDHRTTRLSRWIRQEVRTEAQRRGQRGLPMDDVFRIMDEGIGHAKAGAFADGGRLSWVEGEPIILPAGFQRRGYVCHYQDRDRMRRVE